MKEVVLIHNGFLHVISATKMLHKKSCTTGHDICMCLFGGLEFTAMNVIR